MVQSEVLVIEVADRIATVTMNRPERRNALNAPLRHDLRAAVREIEADPGVDVTILTGADPAFCAGLDLSEFTTRDSGVRDDALPQTRDRGPLGAHSKPVIVAINGAAVTGGLELALACDFLVASEKARFADTHTRVGILPGWGLTVLLPEAVGVRRAREMSATGNYLDAQLALSWGLVNHVVAHDDLLGECRAIAAAVVSNDQQAVRKLLETYDRTTSTTQEEGWRIEADVHAQWTRSSLERTGSTERMQAVIDRGRSQVADPRT